MNNSKESILIVDDTLENLQLLSNILNEHGYEVRVAVNGVVALKSIQAILPDLILLDINMPQMDGYEVCKHLKADPKTDEVPVIFISALNDAIDKVKAFSIGGVDYITKPFQVEEVVARIENQLRNTRLKKQLQQSEAETRKKADKLQEALQKIQDFETKMNTEKMFMLGKLVSVISYEISNPINFIVGNIDRVNQYMADLVELLDLYQKLLPNSPAEIQKRVKNMELDFIKSDFTKTLKSMKNGAKRIAETILSLQKFSGADESGFKEIDLHECIENSLMILQYRIKEKPYRPAIIIKRNYGELPLVECFIGHLNQVFMNILSHIIDGLEKGEFASKMSLPEIKIKTQLNQDNVNITISDNGKGMEPDVVKRIFDPFFIPHGMKENSGLGLSMIYQIIVKNHQGKLNCSSTPGQGTEFEIELPIRQKNIHNSYKFYQNSIDSIATKD